MKEIWLNILESLGMAWWVEIITDAPACMYYFGPFLNAQEAQAHQAGYLEDLEQEGAKNIRVAVKRCKPTQLTIFDDSDRPIPLKKISPALTGQA
ncbi:MAG: DUF1816 domain-containing protein [Oculatellaceae cyanobacterium Prado106]|jgi:hypothetical protein|nr:DUF1816 domain-containing protein [Oculatellaceae cyanobacterium Prado106]